MGKLVELDKRRRAGKPRQDVAEGAEIVLFTGVRYQRQTGDDSGAGDSTLPDKPAGSASGAKRRRG